MYQIKAYDEDGKLVLSKETNLGATDSELMFEKFVKSAKKNGYFHITLITEFGLYKSFAR